MQPPSLTLKLAHTIERNEREYTFSRLDGMRQAASNPLKIEIQEFGGATAFLIQAWPDFWYGNRVLGLQAEDESYLDDIVHFFRAQGLDFRFEIMPGSLNSTLAIRLHELGFCQMGFSTAMYGKPMNTVAAQSKNGVEVREVRSDEIDLFLDLYQDGFGLPRLDQAEKHVVQAWLDQARSKLYLCLARVCDVPVGIGVLFIKDGIGLLADATTLRQFRGKGCHAALVQHRIEQAAQRQCELLTSFVEFGSVSHRNVERAGLRVGYTKALW